LAVLYPHPGNGHSASTVIAAAATLVAISAGVFACRRRAPYLLVGWMWYLGMLVPVIGLLQVGGQSMADRYTYLPQIGLVIGLVWAVSDSTAFLAARAGAMLQLAGRFLLALAATGIVAGLVVAAWRQTGYWRDSETLWIRDTIYPNLVGYFNFGLALAAADRHEEAIQQFEKAYAISANDEDTLYSYAQSLEALGRVEDAVTKYREALAVNKKAVSTNDRLASILLRQGKDREALACWRQALAEDPKNVAIVHQVAGLLATSPDASIRDGKEAILVARRMMELTGGTSPAAFDSLAAAQAETGDFAAAIENAQTALGLAHPSGAEEPAAEIQRHLAYYLAGKPFHRRPTETKSSPDDTHRKPSPVEK
jgi:tetratricopeptide (TPR) repeat protein